MNKQKAHYCLGIALLINLISCKNTDLNKNTIQESLEISDSLFVQKINLSAFVKEYKLIPLEFTTKSIIGNIDKAEEFKNQFYILDRYISSSISLFDSIGKFVRTIGTKGNGPGEFLVPHDFFIDKAKNEILILDADRFLMHSYNISDGRFKYSKKIPFSCTRIAKIGNDFIFAGGRDENNLIITDSAFKKKHSQFPITNKTLKKPFQSFQNLTDSTILFQMYLTDTLYLISKNGVSPFRKIDYGKKSATEADLMKFLRKKELLSELRDKMITYQYYFETDTHILFVIAHKNSFFISVVSKKTKKVIIFPYDKIINDISFTKEFPLLAGKGENNSILLYSQLNEIISNLDTIETKTNNTSILNNIEYAKKKLYPYKDNFSNPVILKLLFN